MNVYSDHSHAPKDEGEKGPLTDEERRHREQGVIEVMENFVDKLSGARETITFLSIQGPVARVSSFMLTAASETSVMTMRKFDDFWSDQICQLVVNRQERPEEGLWLLHELRSRGLRDSASQIVAHFADRSKVLLSPERIQELNQRNGWESSQQLGEWLDQAIPKMQAVLNKLKVQFGEITPKKED